MSIIKFIKDWTLPVSIAFGAVIYLIFAFTPALSGASKFFAPVMDAILPLFMFLILFVTFCKVDFHKMRPVRWHLWICVFQVLIVGVITGLILWFRLAGHSLVLMEAMILCVISPCAAAAPVVVRKIGGDMEQMTTYTFVSNFLTALLIPICFPMIDKHADIPFFEAFLLILYKVCMVLVVPMILAYIVKHGMHRLYAKIVAVKDLGYYLWGCSLMIVTGTTVKNIVHADTSVSFLLVIAVLGMLLCVAQFAVGRYVGHYFDATVDAGQALGQKNTAFAIWIAYTYLNPLSSVGPGCYILWQNIINSVEIWHWERKRVKNEE